MVYLKTYIFNHFYGQYLVLLTMVPRNNNTWSVLFTKPPVLRWCRSIPPVLEHALREHPVTSRPAGPIRGENTFSAKPEANQYDNTYRSTSLWYRVSSVGRDAGKQEAPRPSPRLPPVVARRYSAIANTVATLVRHTTVSTGPTLRFQGPRG